MIQLPRGVIEVSSELALAPGAHDLTIVGSGSVLKASDGFKGRAILFAENAKRVRLAGFSLDGNRAGFRATLEMAPPENYFRIYYPRNGFLFDHADGLEITDIHFRNIVSFAVLASRSSAVRIRQVTVEDSGSLNKLGRNNTTGGIVFEEGCSDFEVRDSTFRRIAGNGLWTHSLYRSPRSRNGRFVGNHFDTIGRDAIQVGHAEGVRVEENIGVNIGLPWAMIDVENGGTPVAIDTAGNVDHSVYAQNRFSEIDGKCIDLDGFHDGVVRENECMNRKQAEDYPFGHFGIVMNNTNPDMQSENIEISRNHIDGTKFGGLFIIGSGHHIYDNVLEHLNLAHCNENARMFGCIFKKDEPEMLESGIYIGRGANRPAAAHGNIIRGNRISGFHMEAHCVVFAPGLAPSSSLVDANQCVDQ